MSAEEVHETKIRYVAEDMASSTASKIATAFNHSGRAFEGAQEKLKEYRREMVLGVAGMAGFSFSVFSLAEHAKEAIAEFGGMQKAIAGTLTAVLQWPKAMDAPERFARSMKLSAGITQELDDRAAEFGQTLTDIGGAYKTVAVSAAPLKLSQQEILDLTIKSAAAAKQFGMSGDQAADQIGKALVTKTIKPSNDLGKFLFENLGPNLKKLSNAQIFERMNKVLQQSVGVAEEMGQGMAGSIVRIQNRIDDMFRGISGPVFKEIAKTLDGWAKKLKSIGDDGRPLIDTYARKLVDGFTKLKELTGFIADHWQSIALAIGAIKLPSALEKFASLAGGLAGGGRGLSGIFGEVGRAAQSGMASGSVAGFAGFLGSLGPAAAAVAGLAGASVLAAQALKGVYDEWQGRKKSASELAGFFREVGEINKTQNLVRKHEGQLSGDQVAYMRQKAEEHAELAAEQLRQKGLLEDGRVNVEKFNGVMDAMTSETRASFQKMLGSIGATGDLSGSMLGAAASEIFAKTFQRRAVPQVEDNDKDRKTAGTVQHFHGDINLTQKFDIDDPDRVFVGTIEKLQGLARRPTSSPYVDPFGD